MEHTLYTLAALPVPVDHTTTKDQKHAYRLHRRCSYAVALSRLTLTTPYTKVQYTLQQQPNANLFTVRIQPPAAWYKRIADAQRAALPAVHDFAAEKMPFAFAESIPPVYRAAISAAYPALKHLLDKQPSDTFRRMLYDLTAYATSGTYPDGTSSAADLLQSIALKYTELAAAADTDVQIWASGETPAYTVIRVYLKRSTKEYVLLQGRRAVISYGINAANKWIDAQRSRAYTGRVTYTDSTGTHTKTVPLQSIEALTEGNADAIQGKGTGLQEPRFASPDTIQSRALFWRDVQKTLVSIPRGYDCTRLYAAGYTQKDIAAKARVSQQAVAKILAKSRAALLKAGLAPSTMPTKAAAKKA